MSEAPIVVIMGVKRIDLMCVLRVRTHDNIMARAKVDEYVVIEWVVSQSNCLKNKNIAFLMFAVG